MIPGPGQARSLFILQDLPFLFIDRIGYEYLSSFRIKNPRPNTVPLEDPVTQCAVRSVQCAVYSVHFAMNSVGCSVLREKYKPVVGMLWLASSYKLFV